MIFIVKKTDSKNAKGKTNDGDAKEIGGNGESFGVDVGGHLQLWKYEGSAEENSTLAIKAFTCGSFGMSRSGDSKRWTLTVNSDPQPGPGVTTVNVEIGDVKDD